MNSFNIWLGTSAAFQTEMVALIKNGTPAVEFPGLNQLDEATIALLGNTHDAGNVSKLFKLWPGPGNKNYRVWSFYFAKPLDGPVIRSDIDAMAATYPGDFLPMGAWRCSDGREVGATYSEEIIADPEADPPIEGVPSEQTAPGWWPVPAQVVNFMPDIGGSPATEPTDVNILFGQALRDFSSFYA